MTSLYCKRCFYLFLLFLVSFCYKNEELSGGATTTYDFSLGAFSRIASNVKNIEKIHKFNRGSSIFKVVWTSDSFQSFSGLGPLFNASSCAACHTLNSRGRNIFPNEKEFFSMSFKISSAENYGKVLQLKSIDEKNIPQEVTISVNFEEIFGEFPDGERYTLLKPAYKLKNWNYGTISDFQFSPRVAPAVYGLGLLSLIPEEDLKKKEDINDSNNDGISGKLNLVENHVTRQKEIGRFGWKAAQPNLRQFIANALLEDIGITSEIFTEQNCTKAQLACKQKQSNGIEIDSNSLDDLEFYVRYLAVPARRNLKSQDIKIGKNLFISIGCEKCHISEWKTGKNLEHPELSEQTIYPYTDLMLHDMGDGLADGFEEFLADGKEWRTPPLWGIGLYSQISQHNFLLHDGRARGLQEAILWHEGEAKFSKEKYMNLNKKDRERILKFLESL